MALHRRLDRWSPGDWTHWAVPGLAAALLAGLLSANVEAGLGLRRTLVVVGGPAFLLTGLHARLSPYLHDEARARLVVLPIPPRTHFRAAHRHHRRDLGVSLLLGTLAVVATLGWPHPAPAAWSLLGDWLVLAGLSLLVEPCIPALGAWLGRRFPPQSLAHQLQHSLGGGWTLPEAVVHLYGPALGLGLAMVLALPGQLLVDRWAEAAPIPAGLPGWTAASFAIATALRLAAPRIYAAGMFEAVPFLAEATKSLSGPAVPDPVPAWVHRVRPILRLTILQFLRLTPLPRLRLLLLGAATLLAARAPAGSTVAIAAAAAALWALPAARLLRSRSGRARMMVALPVPAPAREGRSLPALGLLLAPVAAAASVVTVATLHARGVLS